MNYAAVIVLDAHTQTKYYNPVEQAPRIKIFNLLEADNQAHNHTK